MQTVKTQNVETLDDRRNRIFAKLAKAEGALVVAEQELAVTAARALTAPDDKIEACGALASLDNIAANACEARVRLIEKALPAFDVMPTQADVDWAKKPENVARIRKIVRSTTRGVGREAAIVKLIRAARQTS